VAGPGVFLDPPRDRDVAVPAPPPLERRHSPCNVPGQTGTERRPWTQGSEGQPPGHLGVRGLSRESVQVQRIPVRLHGLGTGRPAVALLLTRRVNGGSAPRTGSPATALTYPGRRPRARPERGGSRTTRVSEITNPFLSYRRSDPGRVPASGRRAGLRSHPRLLNVPVAGPAGLRSSGPLTVPV